MEKTVMLNPDLEWNGDNRAELNHFILENSWKPGDTGAPPVAIFDWDNTIIKNDIGDYFFTWMLRHDLVLQAPEKNWKHSSRYLSKAALLRLNEVTRQYEPGQPLRTSTDMVCAAEFISIYTSGKTASGVVAFEGYDRHTMQPAYAWTSQLMAGYMPQQICGFAEKAISEALAASPGTKAEVGGNSETSAWVRIYPQMKDLIKQLQVHGFDVWIVSASNQYIIEAFSPRVGINPDHVIGVRQMLDAKGMITYNLRGCGPVADGENSLITYKTGKRCWINSEIFGVSPDKAMLKHEDPRKPQLFAAGDSDTDMPFVADASGLHLVINRNKPELMCHALNNADGKWLINPMFIDPLPKRETPYPCSSRACVTPGGALEPCRDQDGSILNDKYE